MQAAKFGDVAAVENHFASSKGKKSDCNHLDEHHMSPLHYAARGDRVDVVKMLIDHGAGKLLLVLTDLTLNMNPFKPT